MENEEMQHVDFEEESEDECCEGVEDLDIPYTPLVQKSGIIQHEHRNIDERPDSLVCGTPSKGTELKVYFNADDTERQTEDRILRAFAARKFAQEQVAKQEVPK
jgi:hypothetical protein